MSRQNPIFVHLLLILVFLFAILAFVGCKTLPPVAGESHSQTRDSVRTEYVHDSIYIDRWHKEYQKGDTFYIHDSIDRWRDKYVYIHDSIDNSQTDTTTPIVEVEKQGAAFWKGSGIAFWVLIGILVIGVAIGLVIKFAK